MTIRIDEIDEFGPRSLDRMQSLREGIYGEENVEPLPGGRLEREMRRPKFVGRQRLFVARRPGRDVAMAVVRRSGELEYEERPVATIGNFEAFHDPAATSELLKRAVQWARREGSEVVLGPMNGDTWHRFRCKLGPWDEPPFLMEPHNPSYYPELWRQADFEVFADYHSLRIDDLEGAARYYRPQWAAARARGYRVEPMSRCGTEEAFDRVYEMARKMYAENPLYTSIRRATFKKLYSGVASVLDGRLSLILVDREGRDAGFVFVCPDYGSETVVMEQKGGPLSRLRSWLDGEPETANIESFGVMPGHRGQKLASAMAHRCFAKIAEEGFDQVNLCLMRDDGPGAGTMAARRGRILRRYALYRAPE